MTDVSARLTRPPGHPAPGGAPVPHFDLSVSSVYREFLAERDEILRHKWLESEKANRDIGFERALLDWVRYFREGWRTARQRNAGLAAEPTEQGHDGGRRASASGG